MTYKYIIYNSARKKSCWWIHRNKTWSYRGHSGIRRSETRHSRTGRQRISCWLRANSDDARRTPDWVSVVRRSHSCGWTALDIVPRPPCRFVRTSPSRTPASSHPHPRCCCCCCQRWRLSYTTDREWCWSRHNGAAAVAAVPADGQLHDLRHPPRTS